MKPMPKGKLPQKKIDLAEPRKYPMPKGKLSPASAARIRKKVSALLGKESSSPMKQLATVSLDED